MEIKIENFINEYVNAIKENNAAVFIGSGFSYDAGYKSWKKFLCGKAKELKLSVNKEYDLISLAQYYENSKERDAINNSIVKEFKNNQKKPTDKHLLLASLPINNYWTTNYDCLIEQSFEKINKELSVIKKDQDLPKPLKKSALIKMHGDVDDPDNAVITRHDYENYDDKHEMLLAKFKSDMSTKTFLFLGYSFSDPNVFHILSRLRKNYGKAVKKHYCIMEKVSRDKCKNDKQYEYNLTKQELQIQDFEKYGINVLLVDNYDQIYNILLNIRNKVFHNNVFISGATEKPNQDNINTFVYDLSKYLLENNFNINTGFGKGIGSYVISGAIDGCNENKINNFHEYVNIFPFPYEIINEEIKEDCFKKLRIKMINNTRFSIIICGDKIDKKTGNKIISNGCIKENEISKSQNNIIIPVAFTGGAAKVIWDEMKTNNTYIYSKDLFNDLNVKDRALNAIKKILNEVK